MITSVDVERRDGTISRVEHEDITTVAPVLDSDGKRRQAYQDRFTIDGETRYTLMYKDEVLITSDDPFGTKYRLSKIKEVLDEFNIDYNEYHWAWRQQEMARYAVQRTKALPE